MSKSLLSEIFQRISSLRGRNVTADEASAVEVTFNYLRKGAPHRIRKVLLQTLPQQGAYAFHYDPKIAAAITHLSELAAAAVFGEIPLTEQQKLENEYAIHNVMALYEKAALMDPWPGESYQGTSMLESAKKSKSVTMEDILAAKAKLKAGNSGLPGAKSKPAPPKVAPKKSPSEEEALAKLWDTVSKKSDELLGIKKDAKYNELMGLDPEDI